MSIVEASAAGTAGGARYSSGDDRSGSPHWPCRQTALGCSILAIGGDVTAAMQVVASGRSVEGVLVRHEAPGIVLGYSITPLSAWFLIVLVWLGGTT